MSKYNFPICKFRGKESNIKYPCLVSLKYDGEWEAIIKLQNEIFMINKPEYGRIRTDIPHFKTIKKIPFDGIFLAEFVYNE
ncbi:MAG TPA: hypothetical protein ENG63_03515, partial [Candidatus Desulfofervidus auxilii]|nr:hypothetical protein [Candidatus Desulfofervidus auxilii]